MPTENGINMIIRVALTCIVSTVLNVAAAANYVIRFEEGYYAYEWRSVKPPHESFYGVKC